MRSYIAACRDGFSRCIGATAAERLVADTVPYLGRKAACCGLVSNPLHSPDSGSHGHTCLSSAWPAYARKVLGEVGHFASSAASAVSAAAAFGACSTALCELPPTVPSVVVFACADASASLCAFSVCSQPNYQKFISHVALCAHPWDGGRCGLSVLLQRTLSRYCAYVRSSRSSSHSISTLYCRSLPILSMYV